MSQNISGKAYKNDLPADSKDYLQRRNKSFNIEKGLIRDGIVIKKDGLIRTNKGSVIDKSLLIDENDP